MKAEWVQILNELAANGAIPKVYHRILLFGPAGTGKTSWPIYRFGKDNVEQVTCHKQMFPEDLLGSVGLREGNTAWQDGPGTRAMKRGCVLLLDEIDQHSPELRCALMGMLNDMDIAQVSLPNGECVRPATGFLVVATSNQPPSALHGPLLDRFDIILHADKPADAIYAQLPQEMASMLDNHYTREAKTTSVNWTPAVSSRNIQRLAKGTAVLGKDKAAKLVFKDRANDVLTALAALEKKSE